MCRWVHAGSLGSHEFALGVNGFIRGRWIHLGSQRGSLGSSGVVGLTQVCPGYHWVNPGWLGSLGLALGVNGLIRRLWVHWRSP